jgi:hypothetical protein
MAGAGTSGDPDSSSMAATPEKRLVESATMIAQVAAADRVARVLVTAFRSCGKSSRPLSELQQIELLRTAILEFDGFEAELSGMLDVERQLVGLGSNGSNGSNGHR